MTKLSEMLKSYDAYTKESLSDPRPSGNKRTVPPGKQKELEEVSAMTPPKIGWRIFLILFCVFIGVVMVNSPEYGGDLVPAVKVFYFAFCTIPPTVALTVTYCVKRGMYNRRMERKWMIQREIKEVEDHNRSLEESRDKWEAREKRREEQMRTICREAARLMSSKEYFEHVFSSPNTEDLENEIHCQCLFMEPLYQGCSDYDFAETYLLSSVNPAQDVAITDSSIVFRPTSSAWSMLEQAGRNSHLARLLYYISVWKMNEALRYYCGELMLDKSVVPSVPLDEFLAQHDSTPAATGTERDLYQTVSAQGFDFIDTIVRALIIRILQNRHLKDSIVESVKRKIPEPSNWAVIYNRFVPRMMEISNGHKGEIDHSDDDFFASRPYRRVHAGRGWLYLYPGADKKTACNVPDTDDGLPVTHIMEDAFEEVPLLQILSIPKTIKDIDKNIFSSHAIPAVIHVCYSGTSVDWNKIRLSNNWAYIQCGHVIVHCTDTSFVA